MSYLYPVDSYGIEPIEFVPVIASYDAEGHVMPLYVRINDNKYKIENYWVKGSLGNNIDFNVTISRNNRSFKLILTYHLRETVWSIPEYLARPD